MSMRIHRFVRTCDIHRAPSTGQSGTQVVATNHPCVGPYPASRETRALSGIGHDCGLIRDAMLSCGRD